VAVIEVLVKPGDTVKAEQSLITVESDKASMEIPSSHAGVVKAAQGGSWATRSPRARWCWSWREGWPVRLRPARRQPRRRHAAARRPRRQRLPPRAGCCAGRGRPGDGGGARHRRLRRGGGDRGLREARRHVKLEQSLITVESDKASMEIPSSHAGSVAEMLVKVGDKVAKGTPIAVLQARGGRCGSGGTAAAAPRSRSCSRPAPPAGGFDGPRPRSGRGARAAAAVPAVPAHNPPRHRLRQLPHASPSIRRLARELGVPLAE
jgi:pyruvate dehydrogenase E2 component (dihydrolipoamide acetyltransferase)